MFLPQLDYSLLPKWLQYRPRIIFIQPLYLISPVPQTSSFHFVVDWLLGKTRHQRIKCCDYTSLKNNQHPNPRHQGLAWQCFPGKAKKPTFFNILFCLWKNSTLISPHTGKGWGNSKYMYLSSRREGPEGEVNIFTFSWYTTNWGSVWQNKSVTWWEKPQKCQKAQCRQQKQNCELWYFQS